jgi:diguanylate cyclase (GGDEF)-like protein
VGVVKKWAGLDYNSGYMPDFTPTESISLAETVGHEANEKYGQRPDILGDPAIGTQILDDLERKTQLEEDSLIDPLTGIPNVKGFDRDLERGLREAQRSGERVGWLVTKIDARAFKAFNDLFGWNDGDECLELLARLIGGNHESGAVRAVDIVGHIGGDDFAAVLRMPEGELMKSGRMLASFTKHSIIKRLLDMGTEYQETLAESYQEKFDQIGL